MRCLTLFMPRDYLQKLLYNTQKGCFFYSPVKNLVKHKNCIGKRPVLKEINVLLLY